VSELAQRGIRAAQAGVLINAALACVKLVAGLVGNSYALVADAIESSADVLSSLIVWGGLHLASQPADENHPFGHGKAEPLAGAAVGLMLVGGAVAVAIQALYQIRMPHGSPAPWTLVVLVAVVATKWMLARRVRTVGADIGSTAVRADAGHHLSDAITSVAAFIGISIALAGQRWWDGATRWEAADDWAALLASAVIAYNGFAMLRPSLDELMDVSPGPEIVDPVRAAAEGVPGVRAIEKLYVRKVGLGYRVIVHVQADPTMPLRDAHSLGGAVKAAICVRVGQVQNVLVHMEPFETA
jgi:cation diffusion facilitator family transporter